ncbi:MAG: nucleoside recognition domain-containing protein [Eubacteriales bacterium]
MLGKCFGVLSVISFFFAIINGNMGELCNSIVSGASKSVTLTISLVGIMTLWSGFMNVLKQAGIIKKLSHLLRPVLRFIFPKSFKSGVATEEITACISANLLGIANAATPLAITAIEKMQSERKSNIASADMITLAVLGCASFNLVPTTVIAIRQAKGALITYEIMFPVWICSGICMALGIISCRILGKIYGDS